MRDVARDEAWLREILKGKEEAVYVTRNNYDGGYIVRVGSAEFFIEDGTIDDGDTAHVHLLLNKL